ncbi:PH domain-containing protein [Actinokineospora sp. G85]|uniref:PH domain-containing protein n=1 Tax=Actinokineospora sp. G85 TaxID=3406626 RepID=UPI003C71E17C
MKVIDISRHEIGTAVGWAVTVFAACYLLYSAWFEQTDASFVYAAVGHLACWAIAWIIWLMVVHPRVVVTTRGLVVVNPIKQWDIPWSAILFMTSTNVVTIRLRDGTTVQPFAPLDVAFPGRHSTDPEESEKNRRIREAKATATDTDVHTWYDARPLPFLAVAALLALGAWQSTR